ncbi:hypothetical protein ACFYOA_08590 [Streptomyces iakyrus]|uniref:hypothetical protein n=1 Tax=Streptomyces iakyrus TaxID=68219 RepID=UPI003688C24B
MGSVANTGYAVTVFLATLQLQQVRGLSAILSGTVFLAPAVMVACSGPIGAWLSGRMRATGVMALAGVVAPPRPARNPPTTSSCASAAP